MIHKITDKFVQAEPTEMHHRLVQVENDIHWEIYCPAVNITQTLAVLRTADPIYIYRAGGVSSKMGLPLNLQGQVCCPGEKTTGGF
jgi:hypothetical protein